MIVRWKTFNLIFLSNYNVQRSTNQQVTLYNCCGGKHVYASRNYRLQFVLFYCIIKSNFWLSAPTAATGQGSDCGDLCGPNSICTRYQAGAIDCTCKPGYTGDGLTCAGTAINKTQISLKHSNLMLLVWNTGCKIHAFVQCVKTWWGVSGAVVKRCLSLVGLT